MGRAKLSMELIRDEKSRYLTYQKRKKSLWKKAHELKTLCGVDVCLVVYGPKRAGYRRTTGEEEAELLEEEIWPPNREEILPLIEAYRQQSPEDRKNRTNNLSNFFEGRNRGAKEELAKLRIKNMEAKYSSWDERYDSFSQEQLRKLGSTLENKLQEVKARIELLKSTTNTAQAAAAGSMGVVLNRSLMQLNPNNILMQDLRSSSMQRDQFIHQQEQVQARARALAQAQAQFEQSRRAGVNDIERADNYNPMANPMLWFVVNENDIHGLMGHLNGASGSNSVFNQPLEMPIVQVPMPIYCETMPLMPRMLESMAANNPQQPHVGYYRPNMQAAAISPYARNQEMASSSSQVRASQIDEQQLYAITDYLRNQN